jgi:hypothetical protein
MVPGSVWMSTENLAPSGTRSPDLATHGESLYQPKLILVIVTIAVVILTAPLIILLRVILFTVVIQEICSRSRRRERSRLRRSEAFLFFAKFRKREMFSCLKLVSSGHSSFSFLSYCRLLTLLLLLLLPLALQLGVCFGLSNNTSPFFLIYHQVVPYI